jgi:hypothetical protein
MKSRQYTIRGVSEKLDSLFREQAQKYGTSLNALLLDALSRGLGADQAVAAFETVDENLWR